jgi:type IV pilus modification protein PilV
LVTLVLLALGALGVAGLLLGGTRFHEAAYWRSQAVALAADVLDRLRACQALCAGRGEVGPCVSDLELEGVLDGTPGGTCDGPMVTAASPSKQLAQWRGCVAQRLPDGRGRIVVVPEGGVHASPCEPDIAPRPAPVAQVVVEIEWAEPRLSTAPSGGRECVALRSGAAS